MLNIVICDDQREHIDSIRMLVEKTLHDQDFKVSEFQDEIHFEFLMEDLISQVDIVFLDIELKQKSGIEIAEKIYQLDPTVKVVFVTGHEGHINDAMTVKPMYFIHKPITEANIRKAIEICQDAIDNDKQSIISFSKNSEVTVIPINQIVYIQSEKRTCHIYMKNKSHSITSKLSDIEAKLPDGKFIRCHNRFLINMDRIEKFGLESITLFNGETIPISQKKYSEAKRKFVRFLG